MLAVRPLRWIFSSSLKKSIGANIRSFEPIWKAGSGLPTPSILFYLNKYETVELIIIREGKIGILNVLGYQYSEFQLTKEIS